MSLPFPLSAADVIAAFSEHEIAESPLGEGGMKSAFSIRGRDPRVLKVVREPLPDTRDDGAVSLPERIRREIEGMRRMSHPSIVPILAGPDIREIGGKSHIWYIEPMYTGGTLKDRLSDPWPESEALDLFRSLVSAAHHLAGHNIVHRDIKPANIVFDESGNPVLLDLGIAFFQDFTPMTEVWNQSPKTPAYAAPEQFGIRMYTQIDFRTDLFLIGLVMFEVLTGTHPFNPGDGAGYLARLQTRRWNSIALARANVSAGVEQILRRLLDPSMNRRYRRFEHLYSAIEGI